MKPSLESRIEDLYGGSDEEWGQALVDLLESKPLADRTVTLVVSERGIKVTSGYSN